MAVKALPLAITKFFIGMDFLPPPRRTVPFFRVCLSISARPHRVFQRASVLNLRERTGEMQRVSRVALTPLGSPAGPLLGMGQRIEHAAGRRFLLGRRLVGHDGPMVGGLDWGLGWGLARPLAGASGS